MGGVGGIQSVRYPWLAGGDDLRPLLRPGRRLQRRDRPMASLFKRVKDFTQSPEGKKLTEEVKEQASKPENRRKLKEFGQRFTKKR
jgi:hypothetical protein